jgi:hypothetical protein
MTLPSYEDARTHIQAALTEIQQIITPNAPAQPYALYKQLPMRYWTNLIARIVPTQSMTDEFEWSLSVRAAYRAGLMTEPETTVESHAQDVLFKSVYEFTRRPFLQSPTYVNGVLGVSSSGVTVDSAEIVTGGTNEQQTLNVVVSMTIPLLFGYNTLTIHE